MPAPRRQPPKAIEDEIEAFLRRAAQARAGGAPPAGGATRPAGGATRPSGSAAPQEARAPLSKPLSQSSTTRQAAPMPSRRPPPLPASSVELVGERPALESNVSRRIEGRVFDKESSYLTNLDQADEQMEARVHQSLDHQLGQFVQQESSTPGSTAAVPPPPSIAAAGVALFLSNPQNVRTAFILQEVLRRPDFGD
jgi:hypothetical protein